MRAGFIVLLASVSLALCGPAEAHSRHHHYHPAHHRRLLRHTRQRAVQAVPASIQPPDFLAALFGLTAQADSAIKVAPHQTNIGRAQVIALIRAKAAALDVPVRLALAIARYESNFNMHMRGHSGEIGAMQVLPQTARHVGVSGNLYGPAGVEAGVRYLKEALTLQRRYGLCAALSAYNHGVGRVACTRYGRTIIALAGHNGTTARRKRSSHRRVARL